MATIREAVWKLRADPFYPDVGPDGKPMPPTAIDKTLNPLADPRVMPLYFDVYDWTKSKLACELSQEHVLVTFPTSRSLPGSGVMFLISGARDTGMDSLANLILYKISLTQAGQLPLLIDVELPGRDKSANVLTVAREIINEIRFGDSNLPDKATIGPLMQAEYDRVSKEQAGKKDAVYTELFRIFQKLLKPSGRPMVIKLSGSGDHDSWIRVHESVRSCCNYVIVLTEDKLFAQTCYDAMIGNSLNITWIGTQELDRTRAERYVAHRLACERATAMAGTLPFTNDAFTALYEPGIQVAPGAPLVYPVGWLRRGLHAVLNAHMAELARKHSQADDAALAALDIGMTAIGRPELLRFRDLFNRRG